MPARPRVLFVFPTNNLYGAPLSMMDFVEGLPERGYDVLFALQKGGPLAARLDRLGIPHVPIRTRSWKAHGVGLKYRIKNRLRDHLTAIRLAPWVRAQGVDLVHTNTLTSPVGALLAERAGKPHVWHMREAVDTVPGGRFVDGEAHASRLMNRTTAMAIGNSRFIVGQTSRHIAPAKVRLLYGGPLDPAEADRPLPERAPLGLDRPLRLLTVGRVHSRKGQGQSIAALAILRGQGVDARLTVAGDGGEDDVAGFQALAERLGVADAIEWPGYVDPMPLYASHDVSLVCGPHDPIPRVSIEANAHGIPTVGIRSGGIPEVIVEGETGWLCEEGDAPGLAAAIERAARLPPAAQAEILREGRRRAYARFNWTRYRDEGVGLYRELGF